MKQLLAAAFGLLVVMPHAAFAQEGQGAKFSLEPSHARVLGKSARLPRLKVAHSSGSDSNANGAIIGAVIGGLGGAVLGAGLASIDENSDGFAGSVVLMSVLGAAGGAGIGYAVDNAHQQVNYRIPVSRHVSVQPSVGVDKRPGQAKPGVRAGVGASFGW